VEGVREIKPELAVIPAVFRPRPGRRGGWAARGLRLHGPTAVLDKLARHWEERYGCEVVAASGSLGQNPPSRGPGRDGEVEAT
jgi:hypothetical protein